MLKISIILILSLFLLTGCANKTGDNNDNNNNIAENEIISNTDNTVSGNRVSATVNNVLPGKTASTPEEISSFTTKIYTKTSERQNNIKITCSSLTGKIINPGESFSFVATVGKATPERGYQEADIFDADGNKTKGYGGGNCQVSTTLYNALLKLPQITITERHSHSNDVPYIAKGKDAAVAHGSKDLKFVNNYDYPIKIEAIPTTNDLTIKIFKTE